LLGRIFIDISKELVELGGTEKISEDGNDIFTSFRVGEDIFAEMFPTGLFRGSGYKFFQRR
jgi:hypothetical protein